MRCTCDHAVIEALEEVARWCGEQRLAWVDQVRRGADPNYAGSKASAYSAAEAHVNSLVDARRAKAPEREYKHQSYGWCPVCGHAGSESDQKCGE